MEIVVDVVQDLLCLSHILLDSSHVRIKGVMVVGDIVHGFIECVVVVGELLYKAAEVITMLVQHLVVEAQMNLHILELVGDCRVHHSLSQRCQPKLVEVVRVSNTKLRTKPAKDVEEMYHTRGQPL